MLLSYTFAHGLGMAFWLHLALHHEADLALLVLMPLRREDLFRRRLRDMALSLIPTAIMLIVVFWAVADDPAKMGPSARLTTGVLALVAGLTQVVAILATALLVLPWASGISRIGCVAFFGILGTIIGCQCSVSFYRVVSHLVLSDPVQVAMGLLPIAWGTESVLRYAQGGTTWLPILFMAGSVVTALLCIPLARWHQRVYARIGTEQLVRKVTEQEIVRVAERHDPARMDPGRAEQLVRETLRDPGALLPAKETWLGRLLWRRWDRRSMSLLMILKPKIALDFRQIAALVIIALLFGLWFPAWAVAGCVVLLIYAGLFLADLGQGGFSLSVGPTGRSGVRVLSVYPLDVHDAMRVQSRLNQVELILGLTPLIATAGVLLYLGGKADPLRLAFAGAYAALMLLAFVPCLSLVALLGDLPARSWSPKVLYGLVLFVVVASVVATLVNIRGILYGGLDAIFWVAVVMAVQVVLPLLVVRFSLWLYFSHCDWVVRESAAMPRVAVEFSDDKGQKEETRH